MSSAILYLAIVAIWACVLVPRWLHRSHENPSGEELLADSDDAADFDEEAAEFDEDSDSPTEEFAPVARSSAGSAQAYVAVEAGYVHAEFVTESGFAGRAGFAGQPGFAGHADGARPGLEGTADPPGQAASRARILQSRRRLLTMLVALAVTAMAFTLDGLTTWWVIIPPAGMLGLYLLLLREAAHADTENAIRRAEAQAAAEAAHAARVAHARAREAVTAHAPQPTAEIIDISARAAQAGDQLYDQYADAAVRAVGD